MCIRDSPISRDSTPPGRPCDKSDKNKASLIAKYLSEVFTHRSTIQHNVHDFETKQTSSKICIQKNYWGSDRPGLDLSLIHILLIYCNWRWYQIKLSICKLAGSSSEAIAHFIITFIYIKCMWLSLFVSKIFITIISLLTLTHAEINWLTLVRGPTVVSYIIMS